MLHRGCIRCWWLNPAAVSPITTKSVPEFQCKITGERDDFTSRMKSVLRDPMTSKRQKNRPTTWKLRCQHQSLKLHSVFLQSVSSESLPVITTACSLKWMSRWLVWVTDVCHMTQSELTVSDKAKINHWKCAEAACIAHPPPNTLTQ